MVNRIVTALATADAHFDPAGAEAFAERLGRAMDTGRIVFSTPIMTNAGRYADRPLAACAVPPVDLRGDLSLVRSWWMTTTGPAWEPGSTLMASTTR